jgi:glutathione S-transferase
MFIPYRNGFAMFSYNFTGNPDIEKLKADYVSGLDAKLDAFSKFLAARSFFAGDSVTHPDFHMYEMLWAHRKLAPDHIRKFSNLVDFMKRIESLPRVADYVKSDKFLKTPFNNKMAAFGNTA